MLQHPFSRLLLVLILGLLVEVGPLHPSAAKADIVYSIVDNEAVQNGYTLSGTIRTDGKTGTITAQDILSWSYSVTNGVNTYSADSSQAGSRIGLDGLIIATSDYIELPAATVSNPSTLNLFGPNSHVQWSGSTLADYAFTSAFEYNGTWPWWHDYTYTTPHDVPGGWAIADHGTATATPEPSSLIMFGLAGTAMAGYTWRRRKRTA